MEKPETPSQNLPTDEKSTEEKNTSAQPKTPTTPTSNNWWGSFISQAKEKVIFKKDYLYFFLLIKSTSSNVNQSTSKHSVRIGSRGSQK